MIETIVNITTGACYLVTAGVIVKYIYSRFVQHKNHQGTNIPMVKKQTIVALVEKPSLSEDTSSAKGIDKAEYKKRFLGSYMMKNRVQVYIMSGSTRYRKAIWWSVWQMSCFCRCMRISIRAIRNSIAAM